MKGFRNARYKGFSTKESATQFLEQYSCRETGDNATEDPQPAKKRPKKQAKWKLSIQVNFDGGARGNPGLAGAGAEVTTQYINCEKSETEIKRKTVRIREYLGLKSTNNQAEYSGAICGVRQAFDDVKEVVSVRSLERESCQVELLVQGDSDLIIQQLTGAYKCNSARLKPLYEDVKHILQNMNKIACVEESFRHVYRKDNAAADGRYPTFYYPLSSSW